MRTTTNLPERFGSLVFNEETMKDRLSSASYGSWKKSVTEGTPLELSTANEIAEAMTTIRTYVNEQRTKYILGDASDLADPAKFIENLKTSFQLDRILEIANAAYTRQYK